MRPNRGATESQLDRSEHAAGEGERVDDLHGPEHEGDGDDGQGEDHSGKDNGLDQQFPSWRERAVSIAAEGILTRALSCAQPPSTLEPTWLRQESTTSLNRRRPDPFDMGPKRKLGLPEAPGHTYTKRAT